jgi:Xaa-Pro dipeptidase
VPVAAEASLETRIDDLADAAAAAELDGLLLTSDASIAYLTGFRPLQLERFFGVVVLASGGGFLVVPRLDEGQVAGAPARLERLVYDAGSTGLPELVRALGGRVAIGVEENHLVMARARTLAEAGIDIVASADAVMARRARKDAGEIERIRVSCELVAEALERLFEELRPGAVERRVNARIEAHLREQGATDVHPLILFGESSANPHGQPGERELRAGDVVCADLSASLDGYWGDLTRCATVGPPSEWAQETWSVVRDAQAAAIDATRAGFAAADVDAAQRRIVANAPELGACLHGAGHAIGLDVHEPPFLVPGNDEVLEEGMVFTIEPGLYRRDVGGIRLEDDVLVAQAGPTMLSSLRLELVEITSGSSSDAHDRRGGIL